MRFQVGRFTRELSRDGSGEVKVEWQPRRPLYLNRAERRQYHAARGAFLDSTGPGETCTRATTMKSRTSSFLAIAAAALLAGCARGGGIGLEAMLADHNCDQAGYQLGTPQYAACRTELARRSAMNAAAMQAFYARQAELARQNQSQMCSYNGSNIGGITGGTMSCRYHRAHCECSQQASVRTEILAIFDWLTPGTPSPAFR